MTRRLPGYMRERQERAAYYRTEGDMLVNAPSGWEVDRNHQVDWTRGGFWYGVNSEDDQACPAWWVGDDRYSSIVEGNAIGPNGPWIQAGASILPSVTRCLDIIVNAIVRTNWRYTDAAGNTLAPPLWIRDPQLLGRAPGPVQPVLPAGLRMDGQSFWSTFLSHAILWGLSAFVCVESADGTPLPGTLRIINPYLLDQDSDGHWVIDPNGDAPVRTSFDGKFIMGAQIWRLVTMRGLTPNDGKWAEGVLTRHYDTFRLGANVTKYIADTMRSGIPSGFLKVSTPNFKDEDARDLRDSWMKAHGRGKRSVAVLNSTVDYQPISINPVDANAEGLVHVYRGDVAHAFGLSSVWLDEGASGLTYSNVSDRRRDLVDVSLGGWSESLTQVLSALMPYGQTVAMNWATFTQPNMESQVQYLSLAVQTGLMTEMEARQFMGIEPWTGRDPNYDQWLAAYKASDPTPPVPQVAITAKENS